MHSLSMPAYLSASLGVSKVDVFVLGGLSARERRDPAFEIKDSIFPGSLSPVPARARARSEPILEYFECIGWTGRRRLPSLRYLRESLVGIQRAFFISLFLLSLSRSCFGPFFYEKWGQARVSLLAGVLEETPPRNSRRSIFLLEINGHADTREKKTPLGSIESSVILSCVNFVPVIRNRGISVSLLASHFYFSLSRHRSCFTHIRDLRMHDTPLINKSEKHTRTRANKSTDRFSNIFGVYVNKLIDIFIFKLTSSFEAFFASQSPAILSRDVIFHTYLYTNFSVYVNRICSSRFDSTVEFRPKGRPSDTARGTLTSWRSETTLQEFPLKESSPANARGV